MLMSVLHKFLDIEYDPITKTTLNIINYIYIFVKVGVMIQMNFLIVPTFLGILVDFVTVDFFDATIAQRIEYFKYEYISAIGLHWLLGVVFLVQFSMTVKILREFLRKGVLFFINNPDDPQFNYIREVIKVSYCTIFSSKDTSSYSNS